MIKGKLLVDWIKENPEYEYLLEEWDTAKNRIELGLEIKDVSFRSSRKVYWICRECGESYQQCISNRTANNRGCKECRKKVGKIKKRQKIIAKNGSLKDWCDRNNRLGILEEWDYEKNMKEFGIVGPESISPYSEYKINWICDKGHEYKMIVGNKTAGGHRCPVCNKANLSSMPEQAIYYYLKPYFPNIINSYEADWLEYMEIDIVIPELNLGIEFDGQGWHQVTYQRDYKKNRLCKKQGLTLVRIREEKCPILLDKDCKYIYTEKSKRFNSHINKALEELVEYINQKYNLNIKIDINVERDMFEIISQLRNIENEQSLAAVNPELAKEWHPTKNGKLKPEYVHHGSGLRVWWLCPDCGNEYQACVDARSRLGTICRKCFFKRMQTRYDAIWDEKYLIVKNYYLEHGNSIKMEKTTIAYDSEGNEFNVYNWISNSKSKYKKGKLDKRKYDLLKEIGVF